MSQDEQKHHCQLEAWPQYILTEKDRTWPGEDGEHAVEHGIERIDWRKKDQDE
jgi:hypothetical protein